MPLYNPPASSGFESEDTAIFPTQLAGQTNDYNPTGLSTARTIFLDGAGFAITGMVAQTSGRRIRIYSIGPQPLIICNATSPAAGNSSIHNVFFMPTNSDLVLSGVYDPDTSAEIGGFADFVYSNLYTAWILIAKEDGINTIGLSFAIKSGYISF